MSNDKKRLTKIEKESKAKDEARKAEIAAIPPSLSNVAGYGGNGYRPPTPAANSPDWREWISTPKVEVWQACALSLNIDPHSLKRRDGYMSESGGSPYFEDNSFPSKAIREECNLRRRVLIANLRDDPKKFSLTSSTASGYSEVRLSEFAAWALSIGWDIPAELVAIARKHGEQASAPAAQNDAPVTPAKVSPGDTAEETPAERRAKLDITGERGCRRRILEGWTDIEKVYGPNADGRQVLRFLKQDNNESQPALKTVQNHLARLRTEKLIP